MSRRKCEVGSLPGFSPEQTGRNRHCYGLRSHFRLPTFRFSGIYELENKASKYGKSLHEKLQHFFRPLICYPTIIPHLKTELVKEDRNDSSLVDGAHLFASSVIIETGKIADVEYILNVKLEGMTHRLFIHGISQT